jgi:hypothetical protein
MTHGWLRYLLLAAGVVLVIELASLLAYRRVGGEWFSYERLDARRATVASEIAAPGGPRERDERLALHPYVGYALDPGHPEASRVHAYGFQDLDVVLAPPRPDRFVIAIFGGSVAGQLWGGRAAIEREIRTLEAFRDREIEFVRLAVGGFKQPQQALALEYLIALGAHFDLVINLDGFNEIVLPRHSNARHGVFPFYPRNWYGWTADVSDADLVRRAGRIAVLGDLRRSWARWMSGGVPSRSVTANLVWHAGDRLLAARIFARRSKPEHVDEQARYSRTGPRGPFERDAVLKESAQVWARASIAMHALAQQHGFRYLHLLQPNQYLEGSKHLSSEELRAAIDLDGGYGPIARDGYGYLIESGDRIAAAGVDYHDLTGLFADESGTMYSDACCHLNRHGRELMAERVARIVRASLSRAMPRVPS